MNNRPETISRILALNSPTASRVPRKYSYPEHGGQAHLIQKGFFNANHWLDFSASINPLGPSRNIEQALEDALATISRYPDTQSSELKQALGRYLGTEESKIVITNGATELIYLLPHLMKTGQEVLAMVPVFSEYLKAFALSNVPVRTLTYDIGKDFKPPMDRLIDLLNANPKIGAVVIGHPNSPTGRLWDQEDLEILAKHCEDKEKLLIVDETFIDFCPERTSTLDRFKDFPNLISIRSMTKYFALPGLRLGYGVMHSKWVQIIEKFRPPWSVNSLAQELGLASLKDHAFIKNSRSFVCEQRKILLGQLSEMPWLKVYPSDTNFILFRLRGKQKTLAKRFYYRLLQNGILLRNCGNFEGLDETFFRMSVQSSEENKLLLSKMKNYFSSWATE
jgi:threonine-phosphate decarboxylase